MSKTGATAFKTGFIRRTALARKRAGMSQEDMALSLGTAQGTYKNYELDRCLPHQHVNTFCRVTHVDIEWLYTGKAARISRNHKLSA